MLDRAAQAASFGAAAAAYERGRPSYPPAALDWLLAGGAQAPRQAVDLGAGTGKLTRLLVDRGLEVTAVEPSDGMREQLALAVPGATALAGSAESLPLADASADVMLVAQAWHWVDPARAVPEAARVLRSGGALALVWNLRDVNEPWVGELELLLHPVGAEATDGVGVEEFRDFTGLFGPVERFGTSWTAEMDIDEVVDMVASRSYVIILPEADRAELLAAVRSLAERNADPATGHVRMPYLTECYRTRRV